MNQGMASNNHTPVPKAMRTESPQLLLAVEAFTSTANRIPTMIARMTISPTEEI
jgi:hypothetical protein